MNTRERVIFLNLYESIELANKQQGFINQSPHIYRWKPKVDLVRLNQTLNKPKKLRLKKRFKNLNFKQKDNKQ